MDPRWLVFESAPGLHLDSKMMCCFDAIAGATCGWTWIREHIGAAFLCLLHHLAPHQHGRQGHPIKPLGEFLAFLYLI